MQFEGVTETPPIDRHKKTHTKDLSISVLWIRPQGNVRIDWFQTQKEIRLSVWMD